MKFSSNATAIFLAVAAIISTSATASNVSQRTVPIWEDWIEVKEHFFNRILNSKCPDVGSEELKTHWDYDYERYINEDGMSELEALSQDCTLFHRFRNPNQLGSRLIRHVFHDAAGGFNGFVNVWDTIENPALYATQKVLKDDYHSLVMAAQDSGDLRSCCLSS